MIKLPIELFANYPVLFILIAIPAVITILFKVLNARTDSSRVTLKYIEIASSILKPTFNTTNKKQIYLTEQLFQSNYKYPFTYQQISVLLNCESPSRAISEFPKICFFLKYSITKNSFVEKDKGIYKLSALWTGAALIVMYAVLAFSGIYLGIIGLSSHDFILLISDLSAATAYTIAGFALIVSAALLFFAYKSLTYVFRKSEAKSFLKEHF
jgi:hypothetical protein